MMRWPRSFAEANNRRYELIVKGMGAPLTKEEKREWVLVDTFVGAWIDYKHPVDDTRLKVLEAMVERLERGMNACPKR
jgi:hypothetical protein